MIGPPAPSPSPERFGSHELVSIDLARIGWLTVRDLFNRSPRTRQNQSHGLSVAGVSAFKVGPARSFERVAPNHTNPERLKAGRSS